MQESQFEELLLLFTKMLKDSKKKVVVHQNKGIHRENESGLVEQCEI